ncbi:MAG: MogA/MoaB family molybdenum cofactor biosynthesis protein [Desulfovibrio sp.]
MSSILLQLSGQHEYRMGSKCMLVPEGVGFEELSTLPQVSAPSGICLGNELRAGRTLESGAEPLFKLINKIWLPTENCMCPCWIMEVVHSSLGRIMSGKDAFSMECALANNGWALAWITLSDKGAAGIRVDESGPLVGTLISERLNLSHQNGFLLPDSKHQLQSLITRLALDDGYDLVVTTGGTGVSPRDFTPDATIAVLEKRLEGLERAITLTSLEKTPYGAVSRGLCGILGDTLVINLPGSPRAVEECLQPVLPVLKHVLEKLHGDPADCAVLRG